MKQFFYRLTETDDPEERLEDAALFKALHDVYGEALVVTKAMREHLPEGAIIYGRENRFSRGNTPDIPYWNNAAFLEASKRYFRLCDWDEAKEAVAELHSSGREAFIKYTKAKAWIGRVPVGSSLMDVAEEMAYSFIDMGPCLMVQETVKMQFEHRFFVVDGEIVTSSPNAAHLTPLDYPQKHPFMTPQDKTPWRNGIHQYDSWEIFDLMEVGAAELADQKDFRNSVIDMAIVPDRGAVCVEVNPLAVGGVGLFACNVRWLASAIHERDF